MSDPSGREDGDAAAIEQAVSAGRHPVRSIAITLLQLLICGFAVWLVVRLDLVDFSLLAGLLDHPGAIAIVFCLSLATVPVAGFRWYLLMRAQAVDVRLLPTIRVTAIAAAGNALILGGIGGEVVRVAFAARRIPGQRTAALTSIVLDRVLAMLGALLIGSAAIPTLSAAIAGSHVLSVAATFLIGGLLAAISAMAIAILAVGARQITQLVEGWVRPRRLAEFILHTMRAIACYRTQWRVLVACALLSACVAAVGPICLFILCSTQGAGDVGYAGLVFATSIASIANLLPISPGGLGVGEGVFAQLCVLLGGAAVAAQYGTVFLGNRAVSTVALLAGLLVALGQRSKAS
ncbi:lysylphosphatidylglycerol synthase transmembrane domain-containing protein [Dongia sedimenti]|uniref:Lysylphosphatidylglycerol synthase transmembrane domain-containing protein n=1 Tax=Dongia sedimenti TaxID=3064282 RepID=A0ABU0YMB3_9PROT|nr:lysylphosphatidylglycerol synthase transmembrane domain-containing protein [Rhodospirillaceae bacterium R-7]